MLKDYTTIKSKKCSIEKFLNLDLAFHNSQVVKYADDNEDVC